MLEYYCEMTDNLLLLEKILADDGYTGKKFANSIKFISGAEVEGIKRSEQHKFMVISKC